ncbi:DUF1559 family PulG-like putative transporter [Planctomicrobium sp. SH664]|uniref:DUF1559 family PulG-like putative transporter n=1 Tax=Planctomicrobium sp. SH664 TaxID=3448125 RepID=UPI003F5B1723
MPQRFRRSGFTLIELLVVIAIIGVLVAMLLPAVQQAREAARRNACQNNLKQLALAVHNYHDVAGVFPPGYVWNSTVAVAATRQRTYGWGAFLLPYIDQANVYNQLETGLKSMRDLFLTDADRPKLQIPLPIYRCPSDNGSALTLRGTSEHNVGNGWEVARSNYVGNYGYNGDPISSPGNQTLGVWGNCPGDGVFYRNSRTTFRDITDGSSMTFMLGERAYEIPGSRFLPGAAVYIGVNDNESAAGSAWGRGHAVVGSVAYPMNNNIADSYIVRHSYSSPHVGGAQFALCDGSVRFLSEHMSDVTYQALGKREDGRTIGEF